MKKFQIILSLMVGAMALMSCNSTMDDKDEVESSFSVGTLPAIVVTSTEAESMSITVNGTLSDASKLMEVGVRVSESEDMANPVYWAADEVAAEFTTVVKRLSPTTTYYLQAYFVSKDNRMDVSEVKKVETLEVKIGPELLNGCVYKGVANSMLDDEVSYTCEIILEFDPEDDTKVTIKNLDPYFLENGLDADGGYNVFEGTMDWEKMVLTIPMGQKMGYKDFYMTGLESEADDAGLDDIYIEVKDYGQTLFFRNPFGPSADDGFWELYYSGVELQKQ